MIYLLSHGTVKYGSYRWWYNNRSYATGQNIIAASKNIPGDVVLLLCSCHSGDTLGSGSVINLARSADQTKTNGSLSLICSTDGQNGSSAAETSIYLTKDFFSWSFSRVFSGRQTVGSLANNLKSDVLAVRAEYALLGGTSTVAGTNNVQYYVSDKAKDLVICG